ncbi:MFS transporter [Aquisediminimonas profunda]|uniref:MFS transporter n=1 Tax=Aquisediminimonas profunda TaxID=1550733 RepID=UPI001FEB2AAB|nr:MFS transporter [Aquisediminimonas profunda]
MNAGAGQKPRPFAFTLIGIGAATGAAHIGNNFTTYLVGGLIDRFGFLPSQMGAWNMAETLSYAAAMFLVAPRSRSMDARMLAVLATALVCLAQVVSAHTGTFALLFAGRIGTGFGFGIMNSAVNLAAGRTEHPARWISLGITVQTILYSVVSIGLPMIGKSFGVSGMFLALAGLSMSLGLLAMFLPGGVDPVAGSDDPKSGAGVGAEGQRVLIAMALFAFGSLAIWPFIERTAHAIGIPATRFGQFQSMAVLASALSNAILAAVIKRLPRTWPLVAALGGCGLTCVLLTTVGSEFAFAGAFIAYMISWFLTYPLLLGLAYAHDSSGRLAVMTTGTWLLSQSFGSLVAGYVAQSFGGYTPIGPLGGVFCIMAIAIAVPVARRLDKA